MESPHVSNGAWIFWAAVAGFLVGVLIESVFLLGIFLAAILACIGVGLVFVAFVNHKARYASVCAVALFAAALGISRMDAMTLVPDASFKEYIGERVTIECTVFD